MKSSKNKRKWKIGKNRYEKKISWISNLTEVTIPPVEGEEMEIR